MLEFVDSGIYLVQDEKKCYTSVVRDRIRGKSTGSGSGGPKINGSDRIWILIPGGWQQQQRQTDHRVAIIGITETAALLIIINSLQRDKLGRKKTNCSGK